MTISYSRVGGAWKAHGGEWVKVGGTWREIIAGWLKAGSQWLQLLAELYLYTLGVENVDWVVGYSFGGGGRSKEADHLYVLAQCAENSTAEQAYVTDLAQTLTGYTKLKVDWSATRTDGYLAVDVEDAVLVVSVTKMDSITTYTARYARKGPFARREDSLDINLTGDYYARVHSHAEGTEFNSASMEVRVYQVWLE